MLREVKEGKEEGCQELGSQEVGREGMEGV